MLCCSVFGRGGQPRLGHQLCAVGSVMQPLTLTTTSDGGCCSRRQCRGFRHQRRFMPANDKKFKEIVPKKKFTPEVFPSLEERLRELNPALRDPELHHQVNIGAGRWDTETNKQRRNRQRAELRSFREDKSLHKLARDDKLEVDVNAVQEEWPYDAGIQHVRVLAQHCGIYKDLFGPYAYFNPVLPMRVTYDYSDDLVSVVHRGNIIKPSEAKTKPSVQFSSPPDALWTLELTNPDGDLYTPDSECLHWLVCNIRGGDVATGDELVPYLPPVPPLGVGYQRMVFVLYQQTAPLTDVDQYRVKDTLCLRSRSFQTAEFHRQHEAVITPVGLCWYNTDWDTSLNKYYQQTLGMKEPIYEYEFPKPYLAPMVHYPSRRNFVHYMDIHRDSKETSETMLLQRLKQLDPFKTETPRLPYPHAHPISYMLPTWRSQEIKKERLGIGKYRELYRNEYDITAETDQELQDASQFEVERGHAARLGLDWQTVYQGKKKTKTLKEKEEALKIEESEKQAQSA